MRQFYYVIEKGVAMPHQLSWSHVLSLLPLADINEINYYIRITERFNLTYRELREKIKLKEYKRLDEKVKDDIINNQKNSVANYVKNPILIKRNIEDEEMTEKLLQHLILENIENFMKELGDYFSFIGSEYKIKLGNRYNYIDLLLFNYKYNCFVVVELKVSELKKEHIGQIEIYMNYIDNNLKDINQDNTIGIIICKKEKQFLPKRNHLLKQKICFV